MQKLIAITIALSILPTLPAMAWKIDGTTLWESGYSPGQSVIITYAQVPKTKSVKADKCGVVRIPGKKLNGNYYSPDGPIGVGSTNHTNIDANPGSYVYKCKKVTLANGQTAYNPYFAVPTDSFPFHHNATNGEADLKGNIYLGGSGINPGNSYAADWYTIKFRKAKANSCGIVTLKSSATTNHGNIGKINSNNISSLLSGAVPKCKSGEIVP